MPIKKINNLLSNLKNRHFFISDLLFLLFTPYLSLLIRLDWNFGAISIDRAFILLTIFFIIIKLTLFKILGLYNRFWKSASIDDLALLILLGIYSGLIQLFIFGMLKGFEIWNYGNYPFSFPFLDAILTFAIISIPRFSIRLFERAEERKNHHSNNEINTLIIGAGAAGVNTLIEMQRKKELKLNPVGFIDDDPYKINLRIRGLTVLGNRDSIADVVKKYGVKKILLTMPSVNGQEIKKIINNAHKTGAEVLTLPGISQILDGKVLFQKFRKIEIDDLLRREPIIIDLEHINMLLVNKVILVTGAGGSIGREICRQVAHSNPSKLLLLGHGENSIFEIEQELISAFPHLHNSIIPLIADVRNSFRIEKLISAYKPNIIFHASAHKHVPLMESNIVEAITNNVLGIKNILDSGIKNGVESIVYISTDKAVDPPNIMGATKRVAELLVQERHQKSSTKLITVRFGNVLGSRGSVVHTFRKQIQEGGPVTVTDPDIERFFMTIPEAVQLVLQSFRLGNGGEVFVLDMGERIKILDLAKDMIRLSGFDDGEIDIKFTGLRGGEKMIEELFIKSEKIENTMHSKLFSARADYSNVNGCISKIDTLINLAIEHKEEEARTLLFQIAHCLKENN